MAQRRSARPQAFTVSPGTIRRDLIQAISRNEKAVAPKVALGCLLRLDRLGESEHREALRRGDDFEDAAPGRTGTTVRFVASEAGRAHLVGQLGVHGAARGEHRAAERESDEHHTRVVHLAVRQDHELGLAHLVHEHVVVHEGEQGGDPRVGRAAVLDDRAPSG